MYKHFICTLNLRVLILAVFWRGWLYLLFSLAFLQGSVPSFVSLVFCDSVQPGPHPRKSSISTLKQLSFAKYLILPLRPPPSWWSRLLSQALSLLPPVLGYLLTQVPEPQCYRESMDLLNISEIVLRAQVAPLAWGEGCGRALLPWRPAKPPMRGCAACLRASTESWY